MQAFQRLLSHATREYLACFQQLAHNWKLILAEMPKLYSTFTGGVSRKGDLDFSLCSRNQFWRHRESCLICQKNPSKNKLNFKIFCWMNYLLEQAMRFQTVYPTTSF